MLTEHCKIESELQNCYMKTKEKKKKNLPYHMTEIQPENRSEKCWENRSQRMSEKGREREKNQLKYHNI